MENAMKALLIAAGVLVAMLIISLGIIIFNQSTSNDNASSAMNGLEIAQFNQRYEQHAGIKSGSIVKIVLNYAIEDNKYLNEERKSNEGLTLRSNITEMINAFPEWGDALTTRSHGVMYSRNIIKFRDEIRPNKKYKIWYTYAKNGLIHEIHIDNVN